MKCEDCKTKLVGNVCRACGLTTNEPILTMDYAQYINLAPPTLLMNISTTTFPPNEPKLYHSITVSRYFKLSRLDAHKTKKKNYDIVCALVRWNGLFDLSAIRLKQIMYNLIKVQQHHQVSNRISLLATLVWQNLRVCQTPLSFREFKEIIEAQGHKYNNRYLIRDLRMFKLRIHPISLHNYLARYLSALNHTIFTDRLESLDVDFNECMVEIAQYARYYLGLPKNCAANPQNYVLATIYAGLRQFQARYAHPRIITQKQFGQIFQIRGETICETWNKYVRVLA